jgi:ribosomal 50S subunit-recycling heat shock protein
VRLDLFLKTSRLIKRRAVARELCENHAVLVNGHDAKPAREIRTGDRIVLLFGAKTVELEVIALPVSSKKTAADGLFRVIAVTRMPREHDQWIQDL